MSGHLKRETLEYHIIKSSSQLDGLGRVGAFCMADHGAMQVREDPAPATA
jgi:hypothetical protein